VRARLETALAVLALAFPAMAVDAPCPPTGTIAVLIRCAQANSEQVARARAELDAARARRDIAGRLLPANPTLDVGVGRREAENGSTDIDRGVELSQTFEIGGQRGARISAADADLRAAAAVAEASSRVIAAEVLGAAAQVIRARRGLALVRDQGDVAERLVQVSHARADKGVGAPLETELAEAARVQALRDERIATQDLFEAGARLVRAVGSDVALAPDGDAGPLELSLPPLQTLEERALVSRPELVSARVAIDSSAARTDLLRRERVPDVTLGAGAKHEELSNVLAAKLTIPIPLFRRNQGEIAEQEARTRQAMAAARQEELRIRLEVRAAYRSWESARAAAHAIAPDLEARLGADARALRDAYERGRLPLTTVLASLRETQSARRFVLEARFDAAHASLELMRAAALDPCEMGACR